MEIVEPQSVGDARLLAARIQRLATRARRTPGLLDGHVARLRRDIDRLVTETSRPTRGKHRELLRGAADIAAELVALRRSGALDPKFVRFLDDALVKLRKRDFGRARDALQKLERPLDLARDIERGTAVYRHFYEEIDAGARQVEADVARLEAIPKPDRGPEECLDARRWLAELQRAVDTAYSALIHEVPARDSLPELQELSQLPTAAVPRPNDLAAAVRLVEFLHDPESSGGRLAIATVWRTREMSGLSDAKFAHVVGGDPRGRTLLRENAPWLSTLCAPGANAFQFRTLNAFQPELLPALRTFLRRSPAGLLLLEGFEDSASSRTWDATVASARLYEVHGDLARKRWEGTLAQEIEPLRSRRGALASDLKSLPRPDDLASP